MKLFEIDAWDYSSSSSFDEVLKSEWLLRFEGNKTAEHKHYMVQTYDAVLEVICLECELTFLDREQMQHDSL